MRQSHTRTYLELVPSFLKTSQTCLEPVYLHPKLFPLRMEQDGHLKEPSSLSSLSRSDNS